MIGLRRMFRQPDCSNRTFQKGEVDGNERWPEIESTKKDYIFVALCRISTETDRISISARSSVDFL